MFRQLIKRISQVFYGNHGWENLHGTNYPTETLTRWLRHMASKVRVDLCFDESDGFDVGAFYVTNKPSFGPFMFHRQSECKTLEHYNECCLRCPGPWRLMVVFTSKAFDGFDDAAIK